jgi:hypothetical protein
MSDGMIDAKISLTTTAHTIITEGGNNESEINLVVKNIPVIAVWSSLRIPLMTDEIRENICKNLYTGIDAVEINSNLRKVFIGSDHAKEETGLVVYQDFMETSRINDFFRRWDETNSFIFEYTLRRLGTFDEDLGVIGCLRGLWINNCWVKMELTNQPHLQIVENF